MHKCVCICTGVCVFDDTLHMCQKSILRSDDQMSQATYSSLSDNTKCFSIFLVKQITKFVFKKSLNASMPKKSHNTNFFNVWKKIFEL